MKHIYLKITIILCLFTVSGARAQITLDSTILDTATVISGLNVPWEIKWGPDNHLWITERHGLVSRIDPANGSKDVILDITGSIYVQGESGLLGMELHPDFANDPRVFLVYTYLDGSPKERLVSYEYNGTDLVNPDILLDGITANSTHDGSRLQILPDHTILMTTGDAQNQSLPQNINSLNGKILRLELDGDIPADNPVPGSYLWTWGHRNPQGLVRKPDGKIYSSEHGPTTDDELNLIEPGRNYGWPDVHGFCDTPSETAFCNDSNVFEPLTNWTPTIATSDIIWYEHAAIPEFNQTILMAVLKDEMIVRMRLDASGEAITDKVQYFKNTWGRLRDLCMAPDGSIYIATNGSDWSNPDPFTHSIIHIWNRDFPIGVEEKQLKTPQYWPQPANDLLNVTIDASWMGGYVDITDMTGRMIMKQPLNNANIQIPVSDLSHGMYLMFFRQGEYTSTGKLVVR